VANRWAVCRGARSLPRRFPQLLLPGARALSKSWSPLAAKAALFHEWRKLGRFEWRGPEVGSGRSPSLPLRANARRERPSKNPRSEFISIEGQSGQKKKEASQVILPPSSSPRSGENPISLFGGSQSVAPSRNGVASESALSGAIRPLKCREGVVVSRCLYSILQEIEVHLVERLVIVLSLNCPCCNFRFPR